MIRSVVVAVAVLMIMTGCVPTPESYRIPPQHGAGDSFRSGDGFKEFFRSGDLGSDLFLVKDVQGHEGSDMRWTHAEPEMRFFLGSTENRRFVMQFSVHEATFRHTGPVTMVFLINGHELGSEQYDTPGHETFEKPVPSEWLRKGAENRVLVRVLNPWTAPDGVKLGVVLHGAGFPE